MTVGLIGYGRFGKFAASFIAKHADLLVFDSRRPHDRFPAHTRSASLPRVAAQDVVILAVPISATKDIIRSIRPYLKPTALVVDVCSVKVKPVQWMERSLPKSVSILGTHPLFGPDSVTSSLRGRTIVLCPVRISTTLLKRVKRFLMKQGLETLQMQPDAHDRMMAETLLLTQYVGKMVGLGKFKRWPRSTPSYEKLKEIVSVAENDSMQLLRDMWRYNPHGGELLARLEMARKLLRREFESEPRKKRSP